MTISACGQPTQTIEGDSSAPQHAITAQQTSSARVNSVASPVLSQLDSESSGSSTSNARVGFSWLNQLDNQSNAVISPLGITTSLGMLYTVAHGETRDEIGRVMNYQSNDQTILQFQTQLESLSQSSDGERCTTQIANSWWFAPESRPSLKMENLLQSGFTAEIRTLDLRQANVSPHTVINDWVAEQTKGRIRQVVEPAVVTENTRSILVNALYFQAEWEFPFAKRASKPRPFTLADQSQVEVEMMQTAARFGYAELEGLRMVSLPYACYSAKGHEGDTADGHKQADVVMHIIVTESPTALHELAVRLDEKLLEDLVNETSLRDVVLTLPKFQISTQARLRQALEQLGIERVFGPDAELFSDSEQRISVDEVLQSAFISVDEQGTLATAATASMMHGITSIQKAVVVLKVDKPFLFLIREQSTGSVLFLGRVYDPR